MISNDDKSNPRKVRSQIYSKIKNNSKATKSSVKIEQIDSDSDEDISINNSRANIKLKSITDQNSNHGMKKNNKPIAVKSDTSKSNVSNSHNHTDRSIIVQDFSDDEYSSKNQKLMTTDESTSSLEVTNFSPSNSPKKLPSCDFLFLQLNPSLFLI